MPRMTVNGQPVHYRMDPRTPLLWALRDASNLTGTKYGCGIGLCGACTVHIDGEAVRSCQVSLAEAEGGLVTTIENLSRGRDHPVQQAWIERMVPQRQMLVIASSISSSEGSALRSSSAATAMITPDWP